MELKNPQQYQNTFGDIVVKNSYAEYYNTAYSIAEQDKNIPGPVYVFCHTHPEYHKNTNGYQGRYTMSCSIKPSKQPGVIRFCTDVIVFLTNENDKNNKFLQEYAELIENSKNSYGNNIHIHYLVRGDEENFDTITKKIFPFDIQHHGTEEEYGQAEKACVLCRINDILSVVPVQFPQKHWSMEELRAAAARLTAQRAMENHAVVAQY